jgi:hypothetical protein
LRSRHPRRARSSGWCPLQYCLHPCNQKNIDLRRF